MSDPQAVIEAAIREFYTEADLPRDLRMLRILIGEPSPEGV